MRLNLHRAGSGPALVLLHGIGSRWQVWTPVLDALQSRFDVIALDLPGFGDSPMPPPGTPAGVDSLCDLVVESLGELGVQRFHVAGTSLGGLVALDLAGRGEALTVCALSPAGFANRAETAVTQGTLKVALALSRRLAPRADGLMVRPRARALLTNTFFAHPTRVPAAVAAADMRAMAGAGWFDATLPAIGPFTAPDEGEISVPVTIGWGTKDRVLFPWQARRAARAIPSARIVMLDDCGHLPTWDDPGRVAELMIQAATV